MDNLPTEIIIEILIHVIDAFGSDVRLKWRFPLLVRRVSKRLYHIIINTRALWQYLYIRQPLHPYLHNHIAHSGALPLVVHVEYIHGISDEKCAETSKVVIRLSQRLRTLVLDSREHHEPIMEILGQNMPLLERLHVKGRSNHRTMKKFPASHCPSLRFLKCEDFLFELGARLPAALEELHLMHGPVDGASRLWDNSWTLLPKTIRVLRINEAIWMGIVLPLGERIPLPSLTELSFTEYFAFEQLSILQFLDAPRLQTLDVCSFSGGTPNAGIDAPGWFLDFPELVHINWQTWPNGPRMEDILRRCTALKSLHIKLATPLSVPIRSNPSISHFVTALATNEMLLPLLEDFIVRGASIPSLTSLAHARPRLKHLKVHRRDLLGFEAQAFGDGYMEWQECEAQLKT